MGFGFGDAVIIELLASRGLLPDTEKPHTQVLLYAMSSALRPKAISIANALRDGGLSVDFVLDDRKPKWAFQRGDRLGAQKVVMLAESEDQAGEAIVRDLPTSSQQTVKYEQLVMFLRGALK